MTRTKRRTTPAPVRGAAVLIVGGGALLSCGSDERPTPAAIVEAEVGPDDRVVVRIDRCDSEPMVVRTSLDGARIVVEVTAEAGSGDDCRDVLDIASITDDILELEDATSGSVFTLRTVPLDQANRPPGTRQ